MKEQLLGTGPDSLPNRIGRMEAMLPGPLEGGNSAPIGLTPELEADLRAKLETGPINTKSFGVLINASMWLRIPIEIAELAAETIERASCQIPEAEEVPLSICLLGLASLAAVTRCAKLHEVLQTTLRVSRKTSPGKLTMDETFRVSVLSCAAYAGLTEWTERVGHCLTEIAYQDLAASEAGDLHSHLTVMCHLVPELWGTCGQAEAALAAVIGK